MAPLSRTLVWLRAARVWPLALRTSIVVALVIACAAPAAQARVEKVLTKGGGPEITVGAEPREGAFYWDAGIKLTGLDKGAVANPAVASFGNAQGHEVVHAGSAATYAIYWDPSDYYHGDWQGEIDGFLANLGEASGQLNNVFAVDGQYTDTSNKPASTHDAFHGAYTDTHGYPESENCTDPHPWNFGVPLLENSAETVCLTDAQVKAELTRFIKQRNEEHPTISTGMGTIFYLLTPPGVTVCLDEGGPSGHCSDFNGTAGEISGYEEAVDNFPEELVNYETATKTFEAAKTKYEKEKANFEAKGEVDPEEPPVAPKKPVLPSEPTGLASYKKSFCSYHGVIGSGSSAILYAMMPWTAGGDGDGHLSGGEQEQASACQDGGFEPGKPGEELEVKEHEKAETQLEHEEFEKAPSKEKEEKTEAKEAGLAKPHEQEPNQLPGVGPDGSYDHGLADVIEGQMIVQQQDIITDPMLNGWQDSEGNEVTNECRNFFMPTTGGSAAVVPATKAGTLANQALGAGQYYTGSETYNLAAAQRAHPGKEFPGLPYPGVPCLNGIALSPSFTAPSTVKGGESVGFDGMESDITLGSADKFVGGAPAANYATYTWNFGDGNRGDATPEVSGFAPGAPACEEPWLSTCAASEFHTYKYTGTYEVTLTVTDVAGNRSTVSRLVTVEGEPWPETAGVSPPAGGGGATTTSGPSVAATTSGTTNSTAASSGAPVASAVITSKTLPLVARNGLVVRYSVNQQIAGHFDVLLAASVARRIGLHGPLATGLAKGTPPQIMIGNAVLNTTQGGKGTIKIKLGKVTAQRLKRLGKVTLTLRLIVRNAKAQTATAVTSARLGP